ncbi:hypothetical protein [Bythopirellula polymerisocia]|uniref:Uncharacterized protein n=1 Tax=Bythopirellula polymerisocia TaxID=2528003 RepID=A0A5C6CXH1_9BACT|nr:hypothetical protein [Bythopirellula polymerisocia]TWU27726.1 hypothetical protein Pla144_25030 [Bythopirellula polymerisocia]
MTSTAKRILQLISYFGLAISFVPALLVFQGMMSKDTYFQLLLLGMLLWFSTAILWIKPDNLGG